MTSAYFTRRGEGLYRATRHTGGAWSESEQHISPMIGLITHEIERTVGSDGKVLGRLGVDILGVVEVDDVKVAVELVRPGRTIALVEARVTRAGRTVVIARAWRLAPGATDTVEGTEDAPVPGPDELPAWDMTTVWPGGYIASLEVRRSPHARPGRGLAWVRSDLDLVDGDEVSELAHWVALLDTANGIVVRESPEKWLFPNVDLTLHLHRQPVGPWVGLDIQVTFGGDGLGLTDTVLHDVRGPVGRLAQVLTLRPR